MKESSIKVGVITDQTGALSFLGIANANVAKMVINDINATGGLLGRQIDLYLEDSATTDSVAQARATKLVQEDQVDVVLAGQLDGVGGQVGAGGDQDALHLVGGHGEAFLARLDEEPLALLAQAGAKGVDDELHGSPLRQDAGCG